MSDKQSKHTPRPWQLWKRVDPHTGERGMVTADEGKEGIAFIVGRIRNQEVHGEEADANARLIAAAPDLIIALDDAFDWICELLPAHSNGGERLDGIRAALTKAKGEQS